MKQNLTSKTLNSIYTLIDRKS